MGVSQNGGSPKPRLDLDDLGCTPMTSEISCISLYIALIFHICHMIISFDPLWNCTKACRLENSSKVISSLAFQRIPSLQTSQQIHINNDHP